MTTLTDPAEVRRIRDETMRELVRRLTRNVNTRNARTHDERVTAALRLLKRVQAMEHQFQQESQREKQRQFAARLSISIPRASAALIEAETVIREVRNGDAARITAKAVGSF